MTGVLLVLLGVSLVSAAVPAEVGADLYATHCAVCDGSTGKGDGPAMGALHPRPRDFTTGVYKFRSTPSGTLPTLEDAVKSTRVGVPGPTSAMRRGLAPSRSESQTMAAASLREDGAMAPVVCQLWRASRRRFN